MCLLKPLNICDCPPAISFDELPIKPGLKTPLDRLGFPQKCCWCISIKCAAILICILSFMWAAYELQSADNFMKSLFPKGGDVFYYCRLFYLLWMICFLVACGVLMLGIILQRYELVSVYVWSAFVFCCSYFIIIIGSTIISILSSGSICKNTTMRTVFSVIWTCIFLYLIIVVNSYKLLLW